MSTGFSLSITPASITVGVSYTTVKSHSHTPQSHTALLYTPAEQSSITSSPYSTSSIPSLIFSPWIYPRLLRPLVPRPFDGPKVTPPSSIDFASSASYHSNGSACPRPRSRRQSTTSRPKQLLASLKAGLPRLAALQSITDTGPFVHRVHANYVLQKADPHLESIFGQYHRSPVDLPGRPARIEHIVQVTEGEDGGATGKIWRGKYECSRHKLERLRESLHAERSLERQLREVRCRDRFVSLMPIRYVRGAERQTDQRLRQAMRVSKTRVARYQHMVAALEEDVAYYRYRWQSAVLIHCREDGRWHGAKVRLLRRVSL